MGSSEAAVLRRDASPYWCLCGMTASANRSHEVMFVGPSASHWKIQLRGKCGVGDNVVNVTQNS